MKRQYRVNEETGQLESRDLTEEEYTQYLIDRAGRLINHPISQRFTFKKGPA